MLVTDDRPLDQLRQLATKRVSGEFICATSSFEIHVYIQAGRIAWATDSGHPFAFASHIQERAEIDYEAFRQLVEECRREKLPLGETIVEWGLASWEVVRESLAYQIGQAILLLASVGAAQTVFLERVYAQYNDLLTFSLEDFLCEKSPGGDEASRLPSPPQRLVDRAGLAHRLRLTIEGLAWVEVLDGEEILESDPESKASRVSLELLRSTLLDGADFAALRSALGSIVGLSFFQPRRSLWCRLDADSTFGSVISAISSMVMVADKNADRVTPRRDVIAWSLGDSSACCGEIDSFMHRAEEVLGVVILSRDPAAEPVIARGCRDIEPERCLTIARRRATSLMQWRLPVSDVSNKRLDSIGFYLRTMVTSEARLWCFGAEISPETGRTLWLFIDRRNSQGLGWAYLSALTRTIARCETEPG